jgi:hypothetical protein
MRSGSCERRKKIIRKIRVFMTIRIIGKKDFSADAPALVPG